MYEDYGNLAGFMGFAGAGDASPTPVVRYQDLHRTHSPASAGALAVYENPNASMRQGDFEENLDGYGDVAYGDVAYGEAHAAPPEFAGVQPLPIPTHVAAYAGPRGYAGPTAEQVISDYPVLAEGDKGQWVRDLQTRLVELRYLSPTRSDGKSSIDGDFGDATEKALLAFQKAKSLKASGATSTETWLALYGLSRPSTTAPTTSGTDKKTSRESAEAAEQKGSAFWEQLMYSAGVASAKDAKKAASADTFVPSPESASGPDWQKIALWSGVAVGGIFLTVVIVKAVK